MNIKIAICDDEQPQREYLRQLVMEWGRAREMQVKTILFSSAEAFRFDWSGDKSYDILLLDIQMSGQSGIELAKDIRRDDDSLQIVFITGYSDFIAEGYDVSALNYLMKPVSSDRLYGVLDKAVSRLHKSERSLLLTVDDEYVRVSCGDIMYIESFARYIDVVAVDKTYTVKMPISEIEGQLGEDFVRCHRSYIVGLKYIKKVTKTDVILDSGKAVPLSRRMSEGVNKALMKYITEAE